ncbi:MAG: hypothetical protein V2A54_10480, partial [Bacteroidota bacterium]
ESIFNDLTGFNIKAEQIKLYYDFKSKLSSIWTWKTLKRMRNYIKINDNNIEIVLPKFHKIGKKITLILSILYIIYPFVYIYSTNIYESNELYSVDTIAFCVVSWIISYMFFWLFSTIFKSGKLFKEYSKIKTESVKDRE